MIELNLLPDVKQDYIKAERARRLVISVTVIATVASVGLLLLLLSVSGLQKKNISDLSDDINAATKALKSKPQIAKILTVQNQLGKLSSLHDQKPVVANFFAYLNQVTPANVNVSELNIDLATQTVKITGNTDTLSSVNKYVDTLKFTTFTVEGDETPKKAFSNVVLSSFSVSPESSANKAKPASYTIEFSYDPLILDNTQKTTLTVPKLTSTRSASGSPGELFTNGGGN